MVADDMNEGLHAGKGALFPGVKEMLEELKKGYSATHPTPAAYILTHAVEAFVYTTL